MKKSTKRSISLALATALVVTGLFTGSTDADAAAKTKKITMNTKKVTLTVGQKYTLKVKKVTPKKASKKVAYKTSNKKVATVTKKGVITAKKKGTANITVTSKANKKAKAVVKVTVKNASAATPSATPVTTPVATQQATPSIVPAKPTATTVVTTEATSTPTNKPSATPKRTKGPTPTPTAVPTPKYDKPEETAAPYVNLPLTESSFVNENESSAAYVINEDGTLTLTFTGQYGAFNFYIPDNAANYYSDYKSVVLTYKSSGTTASGENNLGHALFDKDHSDADSSDNVQGKHPDWGKQITASDEYTTKVFNVTDECAGGCIRGFQIFNPNELAEGETITITVKSMYFYNEVKEDGFVPSEPDTPEPSDSPSETDAPATSDEPSETDAPATTDEPSETDAPATTDEPSETDAPAASDEPSTTEAPYINLPLVESSFVNESASKASYVINDDGTLTITFTGQYGAFNFYVPEDDTNEYKSVVLTYKLSGTRANGGGIDLGHALYGKDKDKHADWGQKIKKSEEYTTKVFNVTDDCAGNCIKGFQIFNSHGLSDGDTITITIKSMYLYSETKEDGFVPSEPAAAN